MQRPTVVPVFGILNIVFGLFGVVGILGTITLFSAKEGSNNPFIKIMRESRGYAAWLKLTIPLGLSPCAVLLTAGIGPLCLKGWARILSIGYAAYSIALGIIGTVVNFVFLAHPMMERR